MTNRNKRAVISSLQIRAYRRIGVVGSTAGRACGCRQINRIWALLACQAIDRIGYRSRASLLSQHVLQQCVPSRGRTLQRLPGHQLHLRSGISFQLGI